VILLDTHSLIWWVNRKDELSTNAKLAIAAETANRAVLVSSMTVWEIASLVTYGRIRPTADLSAWLAAVEGMAALRFVPLDNEIAVTAMTLLGLFPKDPADRIIVATAIKFAAPIITADRKIQPYLYVRTIW